MFFVSDGIRCFKCTSWENTLCGVSVYKFTALRNFPTVYCEDDCIKIVVKHDGITGTYQHVVLYLYSETSKPNLVGTKDFVQFWQIFGLIW